MHCFKIVSIQGDLQTGCDNYYVIRVMSQSHGGHLVYTVNINLAAIFICGIVSLQEIFEPDCKNSLI